MRILMPVDGSIQSNAAIDFVSGRVTLLHQAPVIRLLNVQPQISARIARAIGRESARAILREQAGDVLRPALARLERAGVAARSSFTQGGSSTAIADVAVRGRFDLIVMGSHGRSGLKGLLFGSMTNAVLAACTVPLLVVRSGNAPEGDSLVVGIAVDGSKYALAAARWALEHRDLFGADPRFQVIHVLSADPQDDSGTDAFEKVVAPVRRLFAKATLEPTTICLRSRDPGDAIAGHAIKRRIDVIVLGSHGRGALLSVVMGSVAMRVAAKCEKPLLLIREATAIPD